MKLRCSGATRRLKGAHDEADGPRDFEVHFENGISVEDFTPEEARKIAGYYDTVTVVSGDESGVVLTDELAVDERTDTESEDLTDAT